MQFVFLVACTFSGSAQNKFTAFTLRLLHRTMAGSSTALDTTPAPTTPIPLNGKSSYDAKGSSSAVMQTPPGFITAEMSLAEMATAAIADINRRHKTTALEPVKGKRVKKTEEEKMLEDVPLLLELLQGWGSLFRFVSIGFFQPRPGTVPRDAEGPSGVEGKQVLHLLQ